MYLCLLKLDINADDIIWDEFFKSIICKSSGTNKNCKKTKNHSLNIKQNFQIRIVKSRRWCANISLLKFRKFLFDSWNYSD